MSTKVCRVIARVLSNVSIPKAGTEHIFANRLDQMGNFEERCSKRRQSCAAKQRGHTVAKTLTEAILFEKQKLIFVQREYRLESLHLCKAELRSLPFPHFSYPAEVGYFSKSEGKAVALDRSELGILDLSRIVDGFDLNVGYENFTDMFSYEVQFTLLEWIVAERKRRISPTVPSPTLLDCVHGAQVVIWKTVLQKFGTFLHCKEEWRCAIVKFHGVLFVYGLGSHQRDRKTLTSTESTRRLRYWRYSFVNQVVKRDGQFMPTVTNYQNYFVTVRRNCIGQVPLLFAGVSECVDPTTNCYIELMTKEYRRDSVVNTFDHPEFLKWWLRAFLGDAPQIICCERDDKGLVQGLNCYDVYSIPECTEAWSATACMNAIERILSHIAQNVRQEGVVYIMHYKPEWEKIRVTIDEDHEFCLPAWFVSEFA